MQNTEKKTFAYKTYDLKGEIKKGLIHAPDEASAVSELKKDHSVIVELKDQSTQFKGEWFRSISFEEESSFYLELSNMLASEMSLIKVFDVLIRDVKNEKFKKCLETVLIDLKKGDSLHQSFSRHPRFFDQMSLGMIHVGEETGQLDKVFMHIFNIISQKSKFREDIISAVSYPLFLLFVSIMISIFIVCFIYPKFLLIYQDNEILLPRSTQFLVNCLGFFKNYALLLIIGFAASCFGAFKYWSTIHGQEKIERFIIKIPYVGTLIMNIFFMRVFHSLSFLLKSDVPLLFSIELLSKTITPVTATRCFAKINSELRKGGHFSEAVQGFKEFPSMVHQMIYVGEQTGRLEELMERLSHYFEHSSSIRLKRLNLFIEPVLLLGIGALIAFLMTSLLLPMFRAIQVVRV